MVWPRSSTWLYGAERDASQRRVSLTVVGSEEFQQVLPMFPV